MLYTYADDEYKELKMYKPFYHFAGFVMTEGNIWAQKPSSCNIMVYSKTKTVSTSHSNVKIFTSIPTNWTNASIIQLYFEIV